MTHWLDSYPDGWKDRAGKALDATMYVDMKDLVPNVLVDTLAENKKLKERIAELEAENARLCAVNVTAAQMAWRQFTRHSEPYYNEPE